VTPKAALAGHYRRTSGFVISLKYTAVLTSLPKWPCKSAEVKTTFLSKDVVVFSVVSSITPSDVNTTSNLAPSSAVTRRY